MSGSTEQLKRKNARNKKRTRKAKEEKCKENESEM
jgi:hypothetical protein